MPFYYFYVYIKERLGRPDGPLLTFFCKHFFTKSIHTKIDEYLSLFVGGGGGGIFFLLKQCYCANTGTVHQILRPMIWLNMPPPPIHLELKNIFS